MKQSLLRLQPGSCWYIAWPTRRLNMRETCSSKRRLIFAELQGILSHKRESFIRDLFTRTDDITGTKLILFIQTRLISQFGLK
jgi:hypothetical protein